MKIRPALLSKDSDCPAGEVSLGTLVAATGKNHLWDERSGSVIDTVVIHYMSAVAVAPEDPFSTSNLLKVLCSCGVSSHYLVSRRGKICRLVPEEKRAWHCGGSIMPEPDSRTHVNDFSIGIELAATGKSGFTISQYRALAYLCADIERRHGRRFVYIGHETAAGERAVALGLRAEAKVDPGERFDWTLFFRLLEENRLRR